MKTKRTHPAIYWVGLVLILLLWLAFAACSAQDRVTRLRNNHPELFKRTIDSTVSVDSIVTKKEWPGQQEIDSLLDEHCRRNKSAVIDSTVKYRDRTITKYITKRFNPRELYGEYEKIKLSNGTIHIWYEADGTRRWVLECTNVTITEECPPCPEKSAKNYWVLSVIMVLIGICLGLMVKR